jgi:hypothetical protein
MRYTIVDRQAKMTQKFSQNFLKVLHFCYSGLSQNFLRVLNLSQNFLKVLNLSLNFLKGSVFVTQCFSQNFLKILYTVTQEPIWLFWNTSECPPPIHQHTVPLPVHFSIIHYSTLCFWLVWILKYFWRTHSWKFPFNSSSLFCKKQGTEFSLINLKR